MPQDTAEFDVLIAGLADDQLQLLGQLVYAEQHRRARERGDLDQLVDDAFASGFDHKGRPLGPVQVDGQVVLCFGAKIGKGTTTHDCAFVGVGEDWVWEAPDTLVHEIRPAGKNSMQTVSAVVVPDGTELELRRMRMRADEHRMTEVLSWRMEAGTLVHTGSRKVGKATSLSH